MEMYKLYQIKLPLVSISTVNKFPKVFIQVGKTKWKKSYSMFIFKTLQSIQYSIFCNYCKGKWQQKIFFAYSKELLKLFSKLFYSFYISGLVFEILRLEERKKSGKSAILDIYGYARLTSQQGSHNFLTF